MSSIGSGPGIGSGPLGEIGATRAVSPVGGQASGVPAAAASTPAAPSAEVPAQAAMVSASALATGAPPVDGERVASIRKALQTGNYPLIPTRIGDAMIAAGMILSMGK